MNQDGYSISVHRLGNIESYKQIQIITKVSEPTFFFLSFFHFHGLRKSPTTYLGTEASHVCRCELWFCYCLMVCQYMLWLKRGVTL